jgi:hypothetical protein
MQRPDSSFEVTSFIQLDEGESSGALVNFKFVLLWELCTIRTLLLQQPVAQGWSWTTVFDYYKT